MFVCVWRVLRCMDKSLLGKVIIAHQYTITNLYSVKPCLEITFIYTVVHLYRLNLLHAPGC